ncbi:MAG: DMT family transporter [Thermoguttaceae bacterium]
MLEDRSENMDRVPFGCPSARSSDIRPARRLALAGLLLLVVAVWGWTFVVVKDAVAVYGVVPFLAVRFAIGSLAVGLCCARRIELRALRTAAPVGLVLGLAFLLQTLGLSRSTATNTGLITGLFVVFAPLANRLLFGVRIGRLVWATVGTSLLGLALLTGAAPAGLAAGDLLTMCGAAAFGLHVALLDHRSKGHDARLVALGQLIAATLLFTAVWMCRGPVAWPPPSVWPALLITGLLATAAAYFVQTYVQQRLSAVETAMIILLEPLFAALFGCLLQHDRLTALQWLGAALLVGSVFAAELCLLARRR